MTFNELSEQYFNPYICFDLHLGQKCKTDVDF